MDFLAPGADFDLVFASTPVQADSLSTPSLEISTED